MTDANREALLLLLALQRAWTQHVPTAELRALLLRGSALAQQALDEQANEEARSA